MANGSIKTITERGFGFIRPDNGHDDVFFHRSALVDVSFDQLRQGDRVTRTCVSSPRSRG
jgi:CspA family cold shock protein